MNALGKRCKVTVETPDGMVLEFDAITASLTSGYAISNDMGISAAEGWRNYTLPQQEMTFEFTAITNPMSTTGEEFMNAVEEKQSASEWMCTWCHSPNNKTDKHCSQCGGARSFIYE